MDDMQACVWILWECHSGPMTNHAAAVRDSESNVKQAAALSQAIGVAVERIDWERAYTSDCSMWEACDSFGSEPEAVWSALRDGMEVLRDGAPVPGVADAVADLTE